MEIRLVAFLGVVVKRSLVALTVVALALAAAWLGLVVWFHMPKRAFLNVIDTTVFGTLCAASLLPSRLGFVEPIRMAAAVGAALILVYWASLRPSADRTWAPDVARTLQATVDGSHVHLTNVRDFEWTGPERATERWVERDYDLDRLRGVDLALSYWMGPAIAHTLVSFEFDDGRHLVFSAEIRREKGESFSAFGGFVRRFESILVASEEDDIFRVRTNWRGETMHLYRLRMPPQAARALFLAYLDRAERLDRDPAFYNTLTSNCTTVIFDLMRTISPGLPADPRILLSGYVDRYAFDEGGLVPGYPFDVLRRQGDITQRARQAGRGSDFSRAIRDGVPGMESTRDAR